MAYVKENRTWNTTYGVLKNNNKTHKIQRDNKTLFQFSISEVTVNDGVITVVCDTITGETINYQLDLDEKVAELPAELENLTTGGNIKIFLALVWRLYTSTLDSTGEQVDSMSIEQLQDRIQELESQINNFTPSDSIISPTVLNIDLADAYFNTDASNVITAQDSVITRFEPNFNIPINRTAANGYIYGNACAILAEDNIEIISVKLNDTDITTSKSDGNNSWAVDNSTNTIYYSIYYNLSDYNIPYTNTSQYTVELTLKNKQSDKLFVFTGIIDGETKKYITENSEG